MSDSAVPGWYHAEGDPPNTERYWDGSAWTDGPRPIVGSSAMPETPSVPETPQFDTPIDPSDTPTIVAGSTPEVPPASVPPTDMPVTDMPLTGSGPSGLDAGFPSIDDSASPGGFSSVTPNPTTPAPGLPPAGGMPPMQASGPSVTPGFGGPTAFPGAPVGGPGVAFAESSQATTSLILSIVGFFCCGLPAVAGVVLGFSEKKGIDEGRRDPGNKGQAVAALVIGAVGILIWGLLGLLILVGFAAG